MHSIKSDREALPHWAMSSAFQQQSNLTRLIQEAARKQQVNPDDSDDLDEAFNEA